MGKWLTRRTVVTTGIVSVAAVGAAGGASVLACGPDDDVVARLDRLDDALPDIRFAERISAAVRQDRSDDDMLEDLRAHKALHVAMRTSCPTTRSRMIREICQEDFRTGDCMVVDRLVVSRTECLISALRA